MKTYWCVMEWKDPTARVSTGYSHEDEAREKAEELARANPGHVFTVWQALGRVSVDQPLPPLRWDYAK